MLISAFKAHHEMDVVHFACLSIPTTAGPPWLSSPPPSRTQWNLVVMVLMSRCYSPIHHCRRREGLKPVDSWRAYCPTLGCPSASASSRRLGLNWSFFSDSPAPPSLFTWSTIWCLCPPKSSPATSVILSSPPPPSATPASRCSLTASWYPWYYLQLWLTSISLVWVFLYICIYSFLWVYQQLGMGSAVETLCGQAFGAQKFEMLGIYLQKSTVLLTITGFLLTFIYIFCKPILILLGESSEIASAAAIFVYGLIPQIYAYAANFPIQKFLQAQSIVAPSAYISAATLLLHLLLSWVAVYKIGLGLVGSSLVLSLSWWIIVVAQFFYIVKSEKCKCTWGGFSLKAVSGLCGFFKLSAASAVMLCLETWYFQILVLLAGLLENPEVALDALSIWYGKKELITVLGFNSAEFKTQLLLKSFYKIFIII